MNRGVIYCYTFENGKTYVGQTMNETQRKSSHISEAKRGSQLYFHKALRKYNFKFTYEILKEVFTNTKEELVKKLNKYEIFYITIFNSMYDQNGYNLGLGGNNKISYMAIEKLKQRAGVDKYVNNAHLAGMKNAKPIVSLNRYGKVIMEFKSVREAERYYGVKYGRISKHVSSLYSWNHDTKCYFRFKDTDYNKRIKPFFYKYDIKGKLLGVYINIEDAVSNGDANIYNLYKSLKEGIPVKGFYWKKY